MSDFQQKNDSFPTEIYYFQQKNHLHVKTTASDFIDSKWYGTSEDVRHES